MANFLKKLQSLVQRTGVPTPAPEPEPAPAKKESGSGKKAAAPRAKAPVERSKENPRAEKAAVHAGKETGSGDAPAVAPPAQETAAPPAPAKKPQTFDPEHINLADPRELQYRRKQFGCTEIQLKQAVATVGDSVTRVGQYFRNKSTPPKGGKQRYE